MKTAFLIALLVLPMLAIADGPPAADVPGKVVYLCDASGSMQQVFSAARDQLKQAIGGLKAGQSFNLLFFSGNNILALNKAGLLPADDANKAKAEKFINDHAVKDKTNPLPAIRQAFAAKPDAIYLISDGFINMKGREGLRAEIAHLNANKKVKVHCIIMQGDPQPDAGYQLMKDIAGDSGGTFRLVTKDQF